MRAIINVAIVGVRRRHDMTNAVCGGHAAHFDGRVPGLGTIVNLRQNVAVDVDHVTDYLSIRTQNHRVIGPSGDLKTDSFHGGLFFDYPMARSPDDLRSSLVLMHDRSEERRVGKECRSRWS